tara:strand:- start:24 stop:239 length:216 start_codon:yes stop_codon:yes gene_type:complete
MNLHIGLDIIGNFGATVSEMYGRISRIDGNLIDVKWSNGSLHYITAEDIRDDYMGENGYGLPIGFYINPFK